MDGRDARLSIRPITANQVDYVVGIDINSGSPVIQNNVITMNRSVAEPGNGFRREHGISVFGNSTTVRVPADYWQYDHEQLRGERWLWRRH